LKITQKTTKERSDRCVQQGDCSVLRSPLGRSTLMEPVMVQWPYAGLVSM
jgi:hypothetical protein